MSYFSQLKTSLQYGHIGRKENTVFFILVNLGFMALATACVLLFGELQLDADRFDLFIESSSVLVHFVIFSMIALIRMKLRLKLCILSGALLMQLGLYLDMLDEFVFVGAKGWQIWGDLLFLIGTIFLAYGISLWLLHTYRASTLDGLTGAYNRRFFESMLHHYLSKPSLKQAPGCMIFFDLDDFKKINDKWGHLVGDQVLKQITLIAKQQLRKGDVVCRSGGEEFEIFLPGSSLEQAKTVANRLLDGFINIEGQGLPGVSASFGITKIDINDSVDAIRRRSDDAMYNAKHTGKAQVRVF